MVTLATMTPVKVVGDSSHTSYATCMVHKVVANDEVYNSGVSIVPLVQNPPSQPQLEPLEFVRKVEL